MGEGEAMTARHETIRAIARQIALSEHVVFDKLDAKNRMRIETMAENIMATVERRMRAQGKCLAQALRAEWEMPA